MRVLITGGAGFIGSHLSSHLLGCGHAVRVIDDLNSGKIENIAGLLPNPKFEFIPGDILKQDSPHEMVAGCQAVIHLAAVVGVRRCMQSPQESYDLNVQTSRRVFQAAAEKRLPLLFASSSEVYFSLQGTCHPESATEGMIIPNRPRLLYGKSKLDSEKELRALAMQHGLPARAVRLFNVIGPNQSSRFGMVLPSFVQQAIEGRPLTVFGNGEQRRCFADVEEVVACLTRLVPKNAGFDAVNLGSTESISILELAKRVLQATGSRSAIAFQDPSVVYGRDYEDVRERAPALEYLGALGVRPPKQNLDSVLKKLLKREALAAITAS